MTVTAALPAVFGACAAAGLAGLAACAPRGRYAWPATRTLLLIATTAAAVAALFD